MLHVLEFVGDGAFFRSAFKKDLIYYLKLHFWLILLTCIKACNIFVCSLIHSALINGREIKIRLVYNLHSTKFNILILLLANSRNFDLPTFYYRNCRTQYDHNGQQNKFIHRFAMICLANEKYINLYCILNF